MQEIPEDAEERFDAAGRAVALVLSELLVDVMAGKKRISVASIPFDVRVEWDDGSYGLRQAYRHTIEVEDLTPPG